MDEVLKSAQNLILKQITHSYLYAVLDYHELYSKTYLYSNENVTAYLKYLKFLEKNRVLTVLGSGDQAFSLALKGFQKIDTFDINKLSEYLVFGLKKALILKYDYNKYLKFLSLVSKNAFSLLELTDILNKLLPLMDEEYRLFWQELIKYNKLLQQHKIEHLNLIQMLTIDSQKLVNKQNIPYLVSERKYEVLRNKLNTVEFTFQNIPGHLVPDTFKFKYNVIILSNILDYFTSCWGTSWTINDLQPYIDSLLEMLEKNGLLFLHYQFREDLFRDSCVTLNALKEVFKIENKKVLNDYDDYDHLLLIRNKK